MNPAENASSSVSRVRTIFFGTPDFALPTLRALIAAPAVSVALVVTQPDRPAGRGKQLQPSPVKRLALEHGIPLYQPHSLRRELANALETIAAYGPYDLGVVIAFGQILPQAVLDLPAHGCVNIHASLLPRWRGAAPIQRAILAGDRETGVCLMRMEAGLDTGPVYATVRTAIAADEDAGSLHDRLALIGGQALLAHLHEIVSGACKALPQSEAGANSGGVTYAEKIRPEEAEINWQQPAEEILRVIRAFAPSPGAFTFIKGLRLKIFSATPTGNDPRFAAGTIQAANGDRFEVRCQDKAIALGDVQLEGKRRMSAAELLRGVSLEPGLALGRS